MSTTLEAPRPEAPLVPEEDFKAAQELAAETTDADEIKALREMVGGGSRTIEVEVGDENERITIPVNQIGNIALAFSNPDDLSKNAFPTPYDEHGRRE